MSTTRTTFAAAIPIVGGASAACLPAGPAGVRTEITGRFTSNRTLTGTLAFTAIPIPNLPSCAGMAQATFTAAPM